MTMRMKLRAIQAGFIHEPAHYPQRASVGRTMHRGIPRFYTFFLLLLGLAMSKASPCLEGVDLERAWKVYQSTQSNAAPAFQFSHIDCFREAARQQHVPLTLLLAVARGESDFNPRAVSKANAVGMMQILWPGTARELGIRQRSDLFKPCLNIQAGARYLRKMLDRYDDNYHLALAAYNYGPARIHPGSPVTALPKGAQWYSAYIYDHLQYVLGHNLPPAWKSRQGARYASFKKQTLMIFNRPFRARAFREFLQKSLPNARIDWFDIGLGRYEVVMVYGSAEELSKNRAGLARLGLRI